jgi:small multidrug resistance pump
LLSVETSGWAPRERSNETVGRDGLSSKTPLNVMHKLHLIVAILSEVIATTALKASDSFTKPWPSLIVVIGYGMAFYFLSLCLKMMSIGVVYAIWSGLGIVLLALIGTVVYKQTLDLAAWVGITLIVLGVVVLSLYSKSVLH